MYNHNFILHNPRIAQKNLLDWLQEIVAQNCRQLEAVGRAHLERSTASLGMRGFWILMWLNE